MKIAILTQYYPPETGAPQARLSDLARRLVERGHDVSVITAMPNYPVGRIFDEWRGRPVAREVRDGVVVLRSWMFAYKGPSVLRQLLSYFSFLLSSIITAPFRLRRADILLWESPPLFLSIAAFILARRLRAKLVMNVSDLWPRSAIEMKVIRHPGLIKFFQRWEASAYRKADLISYQTEGIGADIRAIVPAKRTHLLPNGVDLSMLQPSNGRGTERTQLAASESSIVVGYAGNFGRGQAVSQIVDAAGLLVGQEELIWLLVGDGPLKDDLKVTVERMGLPAVHIGDAVSRDEIPQLLDSFDLAIVPLADLPVLNGARPSKMFELMARGIPFIFCGRGEGAELAIEAGAVAVVPPENPAALADAIREFARLPLERRRGSGERGKRFVAERFDRAKIAAEFEDVLKSVVS